MEIQFLAGSGKYFDGGVNYLIGSDNGMSVYAEAATIPGCSDDFAYITMKSAIMQKASAAGLPVSGWEWWYDGQEKYLDADASAAAAVYVEITKDGGETICSIC